MHACHAAGPDLIPGPDKFPGWGFSGFFLSCNTNVRKLQAHKVPKYHLAIIIIHHFITGANDLRCWRALKPKYTYIDLHLFIFDIFRRFEEVNRPKLLFLYTGQVMPNNSLYTLLHCAKDEYYGWGGVNITSTLNLKFSIYIGIG